MACLNSDRGPPGGGRGYLLRPATLPPPAKSRGIFLLLTPDPHGFLRPGRSPWFSRPDPRGFLWFLRPGRSGSWGDGLPEEGEEEDLCSLALSIGSAWMRSVLAYAPELAAASARPPLPLVSREEDDEGPSEW